MDGRTLIVSSIVIMNRVTLRRVHTTGLRNGQRGHHQEPRWNRGDDVVGEMQYSTRATLSVALYARQMQFTWDHIHYLEVRHYQNVKSIRQAVFKLPHSQAISCTGYNVNLEIAVAAILVFVECPKSIASEVLVALRPYQNVKLIRQVVFKISCSQAISCIGYNVNLQTAVAVILVFVECPNSIASEVLVVWRPYQNVKSIRQAVFKNIYNYIRIYV